MRSIKLFYIFLVVLSIHTFAVAQNLGTGHYAFGSFDSRGFDSVNLGNLNTHFEIPIVAKQGRRLNFNYSIVYDGLVWSANSSNGTSYWQPNANWGFTGQLYGAFTGVVSYNDYQKSCGQDQDGQNLIGDDYNNYVYQDPYGRLHPISYREIDCPNADTVIMGDGSTYDGSGYYLDPNSFSIKDRSGDVINAPFTVNSTLSSTLNGSITDSNGNTITNNGNGTFTDTLGVTVLTIAGSGTAASPLTFTYPVTLQANNASTASAKMYYKTYTVQTNFQCPGVTEYGATNVDLVDHVNLADGSTYSFTYEETPGVSGAVTGRLASITLPTGGTISYSYSGGCSSTGTGINIDGTVGSLTRVTSDGSRSYNRASINANATSTTVQDEKGNQSLYQFTIDNGLFYETHRQVYQGSIGSSNLLDQYTCYNGAQVPCDGAAFTGPISQTNTVTSYNNGSQSGVSNTFDSAGMITSSTRSIFGNSILESTAIVYNSFEEPTSLTTKDSSGNVVTHTTYGYDETALTATSGVPQHEALFAKRGNQTSSHIQLASGTIDTTTTYYDTGVPVAVTTPNGTTQYSYDSTQTFATTTQLPTPSSGVQISTSASYDQQSGAPLSVTGANADQSTITQYDPLLRPTQSTAPDGEATYYYYSPNQTGVVEYMGSMGPQDTETLFDAYGRKSRVALANGQSSNPYYQTDYCYDATGQLQFQSTPYQGPGFGAAKQCAGAGTSYTYDALGRMTSSTTPEGSTQYSYMGRAVQITDVNNVSKIIQSDLLGRTSAVCEISSNASMPGSGSPQSCGMDIAGTGFLTTYAYDLANHKTTVAQGVQQRIFQTDTAGRTIYTKEPERGETTYAYAYNSSGLVVTRKRPKANQTDPSVLTTTTTYYDSLGRVTYISYDDGTTNNRYYAYDLAANWNTNLGQSKGHLVYAWTQPFWTGTQFSYDIMGRVTQSQQCLPYHCGDYSQNITRLYSYDLGGNLTKESYFLNNSSGTQIDTNYTISRAREVTAISNTLTGAINDSGAILSNVVDGPAGPTSYQFGNGLDGVISYDSLGRPSGSWVCQGSIEFECGGGTGPYGNLAAPRGSQMQSIADTVLNSPVYLGYDEFNRLTSANYTFWNDAFTYGYDRYGNRWSQTVTQGSGPSPQLTFNTTNNQIVGYSYDAVGNLLSDGSHTYTYDAEGNVLQVDGGATATYVYDPFNHRVEIVANGSNRLIAYDLNGRRSSIWDNAGSRPTLISVTTYWNGRPISLYNGATYFQHQDVLGTERMQTASDGTVAGSYTSLVFGDQLGISGTNNDFYHFAQLDHDSETDTDHAQFRQYSPTQGRWMSPDPYNGSYDPSNPQSFNRYSYVLNNPFLFTDPRGKDYCNGYTTTSTYDPSSGTYSNPSVPYDSGSCAASGGQWILDSSTDDTTTGNSSPPISTTETVNIYTSDLSNWGLNGMTGPDSNDATGVQGYTGGIPGYSAPNNSVDPDNARILALAQGINKGAGALNNPSTYAYWYGASLVGGAGVFVAADVAAGAEGSLLFGRGYYGWTGLLNGNAPWGAALRIGFGWNGTQQVFRIGGTLINGISNSGHIDLWPPSAW